MSNIKVSANNCIEAFFYKFIREFMNSFVKFQFKGGAADYDRRLNRVIFIGELLEEYGFRVELIEDNLVARLEGQDLEHMKQRLEILGYLSIHTRQIDMIMLNKSAVRRYRAKFIKDIDYLLNEHERKFY